MTTATLTSQMLDQWATSPTGAVALCFKEHLQPVEGEGSVFFPPTYADPVKGYNIDTLADGTHVALVDSVGSQANRIEPMFLREPYRELVPQIDIRYGDASKSNDGQISLLQAGHRLGDAVVRATGLQQEVNTAFRAFQRSGDATGLAKLAPTSLVFGVWDSRGTQAKAPRIVQSVVRAWDVSPPLRRSAQYNPALDYADLEVFSEEEIKGKKKDEWAERGFVHVPAAGTHGGIVARGPIVRDVTLNLVALRRLSGPKADDLRRYILGLSLLAAVEPVDAFFRQGCLLVPDAAHPAVWSVVARSGERTACAIPADLPLAYAKEAAKRFGVGPSKVVTFDKALATADTTATPGGEKKKRGEKK